MGRNKYQSCKYKDSEKGNVLFLILIAVILFGALSYAATQTIRSGGSAPGTETNKIANATLIQYSINIRSAIMRKSIAGEDPAKTEFNTPTDFANCTPGNNRCVFHPDGGGATYARPLPEIMDNGVPTDWIFNGENEIMLMGLSTPGDASSPNTADLIAFMPGLSERFCRSINETLDISVIPEEQNIVFTAASNMVNADGSSPTAMNGTGGTIGAPAGTDVENFHGQLYGCFEQDDEYVYFHSVYEQ